MAIETSWNVACAMASGVLDGRKLDAALLEQLARHIAFYREQTRNESPAAATQRERDEG